MDISDLKVLVDQALETGDWMPVKDWVSDHASFTYDFGALPEDGVFDTALFDYVIQFFQDGRFLGSDGSSSLLLTFEYDWSVLNDDQKRTLLPAMVNCYSELHDPLSLFVVCELLGRFYADQQALVALRHLAKSSPEVPRSLVPMGLAALYKNAVNPGVKQSAYDELKRMKGDPSPQVVREAELYLRRPFTERELRDGNSE